MNSRQLSILLAILKNDGPISAQQVGNMLDLSARTIRYNLHEIEAWLNEHSFKLENKPNIGLFIPATVAERSRLLKKVGSLNHTAVKLSQADRCLWMEFELLNFGLPYKAFRFQHQLSISHNTCAKDLQIVEKQLIDWGLELKKTPGLGTEICGPEIKYRYRLISLIRSIVDENDLISLCAWNMIRIKNDFSAASILKTKILEDVQRWEIGKIWRLIKKIEKEFDFSFSDTELVRHTLYIAIMFKRIAFGAVIETPPENYQICERPQVFNKIRSVLFTYSKAYYIEIPWSEIAQLTMEISAGKMLSTDEGNKEFSYEELVDKATWMLKYAGDQLGCNLVVPSVVKMLAQHLKLSISRIAHNLPVSNPILEGIENKYSDTLDMVSEAIEQWPQMRELCFPPSEIGYIALYIEMAKIEVGILPVKKKRVIVVCPTGGITVGMLIIRIKNELQNIEVVDVLSLRDFNMKKFNYELDAVITTSPSLTHKSLKVICVSPLLERNDIAKIKEELDLKDKNENLGK